MTSKKLLLAGLIVALGLAGTSQAVTINVTPTIAGVLNADFTPADPALIVSNDGKALVLNPSASKLLLQVDVLMTVEGGVFGNSAFNLTLDNLSQSLDLPGWQPDTSTVDKNGNLPGGVVPKWSDNGDFGQSGSDLQSIIVGLAPRDFGTAADPRPSLGQNGNAAYMGQVYLEIDPVAPGESGGLTLGDLQASQVIAGNLDATGVDAIGGSVSFQVVPEPSTLALLGLGSALLAFARKRR